MMRKTKLILSALLIITALTCTLPPSSYTQEQEEETVKKEPIDKEGLESKFREGEYVENCTVKGSDIIDIIRRTDLAIKIRNSVIEGGLDFTGLQPINGKREIDNEIEIIDSVIETWTYEEQVEVSVLTFNSRTEVSPEGKPLVETYFKKNISFRSTTFSGYADFRANYHWMYGMSYNIRSS